MYPLHGGIRRGEGHVCGGSFRVRVTAGYQTGSSGCPFIDATLEVGQVAAGLVQGKADREQVLDGIT